MNYLKTQNPHNSPLKAAYQRLPLPDIDMTHKLLSPYSPAFFHRLRRWQQGCVFVVQLENVTLRVTIRGPGFPPARQWQQND